MPKKEKRAPRRSTASKAAQRMVIGGLPQEEEEVLQSPLQMVLHSFLHDKIAMTGLTLFIVIFLCCVILPFFYPIDLYYQDVTQANVAPGFSMLSVPSKLSNNAQQLSVGSTFSVGLDKDGNVVKDGKSKDQDGFAVEDKNISDECLPLYVCQVNGETKYVIPVTGKGLWDAIWGYVALNADKNTVYGVYFTHKGETAGLGALITEYEKFQKQFEGKKLLSADGSAIALSVVKKGKTVVGLDEANRCDALTGATLTTNGVHNMLQECLSRYMTFLTTNE